MEDVGVDDPVSQYVHLGSIFFAIAIVVWTSVAVWLCYSGPLGGELGGEGDGLEGDGDLPLSENLVGQVANSFAELLLEKEKGGKCGIDLAKLEELLAPNRLDGKVSGKAKATSALLASLANAKETAAAAAQAAAAGDKDAAQRLAAGAAGEAGGRQAADLALFREQLREKLAASFNVNLKNKEKEKDKDKDKDKDKVKDKDDASAALEGTEKAKRGDRKAAGGRREVLEDFLKQLLHPPAGGLRAAAGDDKLGVAASALRCARGKGEEGDGQDAARPTTMLSMAERARELGNRYLQEKHFAAAAHCYEVACLLCHAGSHAPSQLAAYHCNCALACLELGRYGDAVNESNAALVLTPPKHLAVKALYRLAVAHANLKNIYEARRCLKRCLQMDPLNEYVRVFLSRLGDEEDDEGLEVEAAEGRLIWVDPPKRVQCLGAVSRDKARGKKGKIKSGSSETAEIRLDREAGLWHTVARHNNKLYILGGWAESSAASPGGQPEGAAPAAQERRPSILGSGVSTLELGRGSDELHVLDADSLELRRLSGPSSKPPHPCCCHSATMVGTNMVVFGGLGPPLDQPPLVMIFDVVQGKWRVPTTSGMPPRQRQGHSGNAVLGDRCLCIFGGIEPTGEQRVARVYSDAHLLDLESFAWRKLEVSGRRPPARFGHTATNLPGQSGRLLILGGRDTLGQHFAGGLTGLHILDLDRRAWVQQPSSGSPPERAFYHTATVLDDATLLVCGSGPSPDAPDLMPLHLLDLETWRWSSPRASGAGPYPRIGHAATVVGPRVYLFGGAVRRGDRVTVDKSVHVLELALPQARAEEPPAVAACRAPPTVAPSGKADKKKEEKVAKAEAKAAPAAAPPTCAAALPLAPRPEAQAECPASAVALEKASAYAETSSNSTAATNGRGAASAPASRDERIEMMLKDSGFDEEAFEEDEEPELSFEELLAQEKAFFQSEKLSFPRAG